MTCRTLPGVSSLWAMMSVSSDEHNALFDDNVSFYLQQSAPMTQDVICLHIFKTVQMLVLTSKKLICEICVVRDLKTVALKNITDGLANQIGTN